ncbi:Protein of unknown function [Paraburkholderia susongensis]|uniref:DUF2827 domain-containing protein n=2 Tax=Paraburkholderia susongensis TaxID=1515439 RepID=A0A1X7M521_9BURK|nr:Protein of unknown function [Paraburkholderia susongensis]
MPSQVDQSALGLRVLTMRDATDEVDVIIEMAGALDVQWLDLMRARGKTVVYLCCGQPFAGLAEAAVFEKPGCFSRPDRCDEIWLLPEYRVFTQFQRMLHRCPVHIVPYLWAPQFVEERIREVEALGYSFGWKCGVQRDGLRTAIMEPNISVAKTSVISMLACDEAYRADPSSIQAMHVLNTLHMKDHPTLLHLANSLDLVRHHKTTFHGRHDIVGFMVQYADAVVSHQWINEQNYSYLDALYGDYPLIHNSDWLNEFGAGYYYPGFDATRGGEKLRFARESHDENLETYRNRSRAVFQAIDPFAQHNLDAYAERLMMLRSSARVSKRSSYA